ncbi:MAG TPA: carbohydrate ABC transporter permease [Anaerolineae bacterium]
MAQEDGIYKQIAKGPRQPIRVAHIRRSTADRIYTTLCYVISTIWVIFVIFPIIWLLGSTFKDSVDVMKMPPDLLPRVPLQYTIKLDFSDVAKQQPDKLEQTIKTDLALATWRVPDYLSAIHFGALSAEAYIDGRKVAETYLTGITYTDNRGKLWKTQRISDNLVSKSTDQALAAADFKMDLNGALPASSATTTSEFTAQVTEMFGSVTKPASHLISVTQQPFWMGMFNNFVSAWTAPSKVVKGMTYAGYLANSTAITLSTIMLQFVVSGFAAYALSRMLSRTWSRIWTIFFLATLMVPGITTLIPTFAMVGAMGLNNTLLAVIVPGIPGAFSIYLFKGFFDALPGELFDASRIDGASEFQTFTRIAVPMSKNVFAVIGLMTFLGSWNDFFWPFLVLQRPNVWTFPVAIYMAAGGSGAANATYSIAMASSVIAAIPTVFVFAIFSRSIQQGLVWSGLKG